MAANKANEEVLKRCAVFRDLPAEKVAELAGVVENRTVPPNGIVFREGDEADGFYVVASGKVRIYASHGGSVERELSVLGPGDSFGEVALLTGETRTATVEAMSDLELVVLRKKHFDGMLRDFPDISRMFMKEMRSWLVKDQALIEEEAGVALRASRTSWIDFVLIIGISILLAVSFNHSNPNGIPLFPDPPDTASFPHISASAAYENLKQGKTIIIDSMPANFFQKRHIKGAVNMPMALFDIVFLMNFSEDDKEKEILVYGNTISRPYDLEIAGKLQLRGYTNIRIIDGGLSAWEAQGYPVEDKAAK